MTSQASTKRFQRGRMLRVQRGVKSTASDDLNMVLTAAMNRSVSLGISSCRQPSLVSNRIEETAVWGQIEVKVHKNQKSLPSSNQCYYRTSYLQSQTCRAQPPGPEPWPGPDCDSAGPQCGPAYLRPPVGWWRHTPTPPPASASSGSNVCGSGTSLFLC